MKFVVTRYMTCTSITELQIDDKLCDYVNQELAEFHTEDNRIVTITVPQLEALYSDKIDEKFFGQRLYHNQQNDWDVTVDDLVRDMIYDYLHTIDFEVIDYETNHEFIKVEKS